jgi:hypothetical protein
LLPRRLALAWLPWFVQTGLRHNWYVKEGLLTTLLQVVPATVVAVFIFAVGAVFVMVQIIAPTLGSRAIENLLIRRRSRVCVIAGMVLLLTCLILATLARFKEGKLPELWEASAASALALGTLLYVPLSIWCISTVLHSYVSPSAYSTLLSKWRGGRGPAASEWAFRQLRALRQWLRTACSTGESRDIVFALEGFQKLLNHYCDEARPKKGTSFNEKLRKEPPAEYSRTDEVVDSKWRGLLDPNPVPPKETGWFGDEFGRALARCAEVGIRSTVLLRRDLDRLLVVLGGATLQLAGFKQLEEKATDSKSLPAEAGSRRDRIVEIGMYAFQVRKDQSLPEEAGFLLDRIAEMYAFQVRDEAYSDWFERPALVLASLESKLEKLDIQVTGPQFLESSLPNRGYHPVHLHQPLQEHCLAGRALAAWCLVNYTFQQSKDGTSTQGVPTAHGWHRLGEEAKTSHQLWNEAKRLAINPAMHPSWMPLVHDDPEAQPRLNTFFDDLQTLVRQMAISAAARVPCNAPGHQ